MLSRLSKLAPPVGAFRLSHAADTGSRLSRIAKAAIGLELFLAVGALAGGLALMAGPKGEIIPLPTAVLAGSPFVDYFWPGAILFTVLGVGPLGAAMLAWRRHPRAYSAGGFESESRHSHTDALIGGKAALRFAAKRPSGRA